MDWKDRKVIVTGAGGFIGSYLVERLIQNGACVTAFVHYNSRNDWGMIENIPNETKNNLEIIIGDITDTFSVRRALKDQEIIFHLAALIGIPYSYEAPESYINTNIKGTLNVLQASLDSGIEKIVHTSTSEVYGTAQYTPIDEKHPLQGQSPYSASKIGADKIAESYYYSFDLPVATIRPFNTFGPRQSARAVIPTIITQALTSDSINLGSLTPVRDLTYVTDTVNGFIKIAESDKTTGKTINVGSGYSVTIGELAEKIRDFINPGASICCDNNRVRPDGSEVKKLICDNSLAAQLMDWKPSVTLDEGLALTISWIREHIDSYKPNQYTV
jgi:NAD dependent epimerase/dehydratase